MKFLIADDNPADRALIIRKLRREFEDAEFVELGRQTDLSEAIEQGNYDIVLTDYQLNWTDGLRILHTIKERYPDVPVLMFTGTGSEEVAVEGMKSGLSNYILKKHLDNLPFAVRESLEKARLQKQYDKAIQQLRESESRYREIFEQGLAGIAVFTPSGQLLTCNAAFARMFAFGSIDEALQCDVCKLFASKQAYEEFLASLQHEQRLENYEADLYRHNGEPIYIVGNVVGDFNDDGELIRIKQYIFDNTERKRLEEQYRHAQKMESLGQLVSGIAHDFNNMLGGILGHTERSMAKITENHSLYDNLKHTREITERAAKMTRQLLAFSRRQVLDPKDININDVISELLAFIGTILADHIKFVFHPDLTLKAVHADAAQIEQALMNLCINARDAMPDGGRLLIETENITLDKAFTYQHPEIQPGKYVQIRVTDTGTGMDEQVLEHLFEPFFTTKELGKGTGLGLSMVHGIIGQHNGCIDVTSKVGQGTTFKMYLPAVERTPVPIHTEVKMPEYITGGPETILLVEDDPDLRFLMSEVLKEYGYIVVSACDGEEGLQKFEKQDSPISLVIADVVTPRMKGSELYNKIHQATPDTKFLFVSGYQANEISHNFVLDKGLNFLAKPFDLDELAIKVREVLQ